MNKRNLNLEKYGISGKRYKELCGFCEQYPEWICQLKHGNDTVKSIEITDMPITHNNSDLTGDLAIKRQELEMKCELIESTAVQAGNELSKFIIKSVCYEVPVNYLIACECMPLSKSAFYEMRRYFFFLLDQNKKM
ncbi:hypothetical protein [uncultured Eubacterium sp.]|uniref:hypothetical protein n=1 Tax=uncultured Eubacterium sp. TaxID=165185 RepID=UPI003265D487